MKSKKITKTWVAFALVCLTAFNTVSCHASFLAESNTSLYDKQTAVEKEDTSFRSVSLGEDIAFEELNQSTASKQTQSREKTQEEIYRLALRYLRTGYYQSAYAQLSLIPNYKDSSMYLSRLVCHARSVSIRDITDPSDLENYEKKLYQIETTFTTYGYLAGELLYDYQPITLKVYPTNVNDKTDEKTNRVKRMTVARHPSVFGEVAGYSLDYTYVNDESSIIASEVKNISGTSFTTNYVYNPDKSIQKINISWTRSTIPYNYEFRYVYSAGKLTSIKFVDLTPNADATVRDYAVYSYNAAGQLTSVSYPGGLLDPAYDYSLFTGNPSTWVAPNWNEANAYTVTYEYNALGQLAKEVLNYANSDDKDQTITYTLYNKDGFLLEKTLAYGGKVYRFSYSNLTYFYNLLA